MMSIKVCDFVFIFVVSFVYIIHTCIIQYYRILCIMYQPKQKIEDKKRIFSVINAAHDLSMFFLCLLSISMLTSYAFFLYIPSTAVFFLPGVYDDHLSGCLRLRTC